MDKIEGYDQYVALIAIIAIFIYAATKYGYIVLMLLGAIAFLSALALFNKGKRETVNLASDVTYIALAAVLLLGIAYAAFITFNIELIIMLLVLIILIGVLYQ